MAKIISYEEIGELDTYDLEVEHEDHQYYLSNGVLTSNSHAVSYALISYYCAWLLKYYEAEWLCSYLEYMSDIPENTAIAYSEIRSIGWDVIPIDINHADTEWKILDGKKFMPSFNSCKGIGGAVIEEIRAKRPYNKIEDLFWNDDFSWKHKKFNKKSLENLIKIRAFDSMSLVGEGKLFSSYKQMHHVLIENYDDIKKISIREPDIGRKNLYKFAEETRGMEEWTKKELVEFKKEITGVFNPVELLPLNIYRRFDSNNIISIDEVEGSNEFCWFVVTDSLIKKSKNNKTFQQVDCVGLNGKIYRIFLWYGKNDIVEQIEKYSCYISVVSKNDFGYSTTIRNMKRIPI